MLPYTGYTDDHCATVADALMQCKPTPLFSMIHHGHGSIPFDHNQSFIGSSQIKYRLRHDSTITSPLASGILSSLLPCYVPGCTLGSLSCYSPRCPNRPSNILKELMLMVSLQQQGIPLANVYIQPPIAFSDRPLSVFDDGSQIVSI